MQNLQTTSKLTSRYQFQAVAGQGGAGEVSAAWDTQLERTVAIKRLHKKGVAEHLLQSTWQEAMRLASIRHANIVAVYDLGLDEGTPYIVMEFVSGETVEGYVQSHGILELNDFVDLASQSLDGLVAAHHAGMIHRDLKPSNLMLSRLPSGAFQVKILDFGIARFLSAPDENATKESVTGSIYCISPEALSREPVDARSDLYSLGCVFYYALAGRFPFDGKSTQEVVAAHLNHQVFDLRDFRPDLPSMVCQWVMALINRKPSNRYQTGMEALSALRAIVREERDRQVEQAQKPDASKAAATSAGDPQSRSAASEKSASPAAWLAAAAALLVFGGGGFYWFLDHEKARSPAPLASAVPHVERSATEPAPSAETQPAIKPPAAPAEATKAVAATAAPIAPVHSDTEPTPEPAPPEPEVVLRFHGSNTIGAQLLPALLERFLRKEGATETSRKPGADHEETTLVAKFPNEETPKAIEIAAHGSATAFQDLMAQTCDVGVSSRPVKPEEVEKCSRAGLGDLAAPACEHVLGLDGIAILVNKANAVDVLSVYQVGQIFTGKTTDWSQLGGKPGQIHLYARDAKSGTFDTFKALVLGSDPMAPDAKRFEDSAELSDAVSHDPLGIGFAGLPFVRSSKLVAVSDIGAAPFLATRFTVATEDYALSRRLFLYTPDHPQHPWISKFVEFALGEEGQEVVSKFGFIKQSIDLEKPCVPPGAPPTYAALAKKADRLSLNLRFRAGSATLDNKSLRDMDRIAQLMAEPRAAGRRLVLLGFTDSTGPVATRNKISKERADTVAKLLAAQGIVPAAVNGMGSALPVASNDTETGREKNRRVEVWLE